MDQLIHELHLDSMTNETVLQERMLRHWLGEERPEDRLPLRLLTEREQFFLEVFHDYGEILSAISSLELAARFLKALHPGRATADVIAYHIEKHLEETYIIKERIVSFLRRLQRRLRQHGIAIDAATVRTAEQVVQNGFAGVIRTRGMHVHEGRFKDDDVKRVASLDLLVAPGGMKQLEPLRRYHARLVLVKWRATAATNVETVRKLMNHLVEVIEPLVVNTMAPKDPAKAPQHPKDA